MTVKTFFVCQYLFGVYRFAFIYVCQHYLYSKQNEVGFNTDPDAFCYIPPALARR